MPIINMVYKKKKWWKPWANTIAYYPLESDTNDYSWNWHNLSNWTVPTFTTSWSLSYATWSAKAYSNGFAMATDKFTVCYRIKITNTSQTGKWTFSLTWDWSFWKEFWWLYGTNYNPKLNMYIECIAPNWQMYWINPTADTWYNFCLSYDRTASTPYCKVYVNWAYINWTTTSTVSWTNVQVNLFWVGTGTNSASANCSFSNFIIENRPRAAQEILDYYNITKWNYGL